MAGKLVNGKSRDVDCIDQVECVKDLKGVRTLHNVLCACPERSRRNGRQVPQQLSVLQEPNFLTIVNFSREVIEIFQQCTIQLEGNDDLNSLAWSSDGEVCIVSTRVKLVVLTWSAGFLEKVLEYTTRYRLQQVDIVHTDLKASAGSTEYLVCVACSAGALLLHLRRKEKTWSFEAVPYHCESLIHGLLHSNWPVSCVTFTKRGNTMALGLYSGIISFWNVHGDKICKFKDFSTGKNERITSLAFSPCENYLAAIDWFGSIFVHYFGKSHSGISPGSCIGQLHMRSPLAADSAVPLVYWAPRGNVFLAVVHDAKKAFKLDGTWIEPIQLPILHSEGPPSTHDGIGGVALVCKDDKSAQLVFSYQSSGLFCHMWPFQICSYNPLFKSETIIARVAQDDNFQSRIDFDFNSDSKPIKLMVQEIGTSNVFELDLDFLSCRNHLWLKPLESFMITSNRRNVYISASTKHVIIYNNQVLYLKGLSQKSMWKSIILEHHAEAIAMSDIRCAILDVSGLIWVIDFRTCNVLVTTSSKETHTRPKLLSMLPEITRGLYQTERKDEGNAIDLFIQKSNEKITLNMKKMYI